MMNIILGVILWSLKKLSRNDRGKMFTARPRRTKTCGEKTHPVTSEPELNNVTAANTYYAPDDKGYFKFVRETEDGETKEGKHARFWIKVINETLLETVNKPATRTL